MEITFPLSDRQILTDISELDKKISMLQMLTSYSQFSQVQFFFFAKKSNEEKKFMQLDQSDIPFNLEIELKLLITESLEEYERQRISLIQLLKK